MAGYDPVVVAGLIAAGVTVLINFVALWSNRRKQSADVGQVIATAANSLIGPLEKRIVTLEEQNAAQQTKIEAQETIIEDQGKLLEEVPKLRREVTELRLKVSEQQGTIQLQDEIIERQTSDIMVLQAAAVVKDARVDELQNGLGVLIAQMTQAGMKPNYRPGTGPL